VDKVPCYFTFGPQHATHSLRKALTGIRQTCLGQILLEATAPAAASDLFQLGQRKHNFGSRVGGHQTGTHNLGGGVFFSVFPLTFAEIAGLGFGERAICKLSAEHFIGGGCAHLFFEVTPQPLLSAQPVTCVQSSISGRVYPRSDFYPLMC
jgi:hypothetical protein